MSRAQNYKRNPDGNRFALGGINTVLPPDKLPGNKSPYLQNVRSYLAERIISRSQQTAPLTQFMAGEYVHSLRRLNDSTPDGPASGYALVGGAGQSLFLNGTETATGFSGNRLSLIPFRPASSPQPWMYVGDSSLNVQILGAIETAGMVKMNSAGVTRKTGITEPQIAPTVGTATNTVTGSDAILGSARPWSNVSGQNPSFNYNDTGNGTAPTVISTPIYGATVALTATGTCVVNGFTVTPGSAGAKGSNNPGQFVSGATSVLLAAWCDGSGNVLTGLSVPAVFSVGAGVTVTVPTGAVQLQVGIDGTGGSFSGNTGSFTLNYSITTSAVATKTSLIGNVTAYYWGDSPHSGPVASYIWRNPNDTAGSGPSRSIDTASGSTTGNSLEFDLTPNTQANPVQWTQLNSDGSVAGVTVVFQPALEASGYQDFNLCIVGNLFFPAAGTYEITVVSKDNVMWGIGNNATWPGIGTIRGAANQTMTVVNGSPLLPSPAIDGEGAATTVTVAVTVPGPGVYPIELDWDYWYHTGRTLVVTVNGASINPLSSTVLEGVQYRYTYRAADTGAQSNPSPASPEQQIPAISNTLQATYSPDPQVTKIDWWRLDDTLDNFTYVGTSQNANPPPPFTDQLTDADVTGNPILQYDNYEPFPSIDLPRGGVVNVIGGVVTQVSGDEFNQRWLGGTVIVIGGVAYTLYNRPTSTTTLLAADAQDGLNQIYEIAEPILANQPLPSMFGNTDNAAFQFGVGDPLRPGTCYWCKGNQPDSAPDTNQNDVTSPSEPLINGCMENGVGFVMSAENGWVIYPNFQNALATVFGVEGNQFSFVRSSITRGLYIRPCICTDGSGRFFWRAKDGIVFASGTEAEQSITNDDLYNLFPHENYTPKPITVGGYTLWPPDDTQPERQSLNYATGYLYYDYVDINGYSRNLVFDTIAGAWIVDVYEFPVTIHQLEEGPNINGVLVGCTDGSIRQLANSNTIEVGTSVVLTPSVNSGDARAQKTVGDVWIKAQIPNSQTLLFAAYMNQYQFAVPLTTSQVVGTQGTLAGYVIDTPGYPGVEVIDFALAFQWSFASTPLVLDAWQPSWTDIPETVQNRPSDWDNLGSPGAKLIQGLLLEADTFNAAKSIAIQSGDDLSIHVPDQNPVQFNGQSVQALTWPPFVAHSVRIVSQDGVAWRFGQGWDIEWVSVPYPELVPEYSTEPTTNGLMGWQVIGEFNLCYISTAPIEVTFTFGREANVISLAYILPSSNGLLIKGPKQPVAMNKFKVVQYSVSSANPFRLFGDQCEVKIYEWGRQGGATIVHPFGGPASDKALV